MQRVCKSAGRNLRKKVRRKDESNTVRADERERETKLEGPTTVYLLTAQLKACCLEKILDNGVRKRRARCSALVQQARDRTREQHHEERRKRQPLLSSSLCKRGA